MRVGKWGYSLAVRLPSAVIEALSLKEGDDIETRIERLCRLPSGRASPSTTR